MDLRTRLRRYAAGRPHVLIVAARGGTAVRLAVEAELARRDWPLAATPADADVLLVAGTPGRELADAVSDIWAAIPQPRTYAAAPRLHDLGTTLDRAAADLVAGDSAGGPPSSRTAPDHTADEHGQADRSRNADQGDHGDHDDEHGVDQNDDQNDDEGHDDEGHDDEGHDDEGHDDEGHSDDQDDEGHDDMEMPGDLPMADVGEDRDGLMLDRLQVALGPVLPDWPAGLVLEVVLQGDVVQEARARLVDDPLGDPFWTPRPPGDTEHGDVADPARRAARELDALARFLAVAGWSAPAARARRLRDGLLAGDPPDPAVTSAEALVRQVRRSRTLCRMLRGLPHVPARFALRLDAVDDACAALREPATRAAAGVSPPPGGDRTRPELGELERLLVGADLAAARLLVAAADPVTEGSTEGSTDRSTHPAAGSTGGIGNGPARDDAQRVGQGAVSGAGDREAPHGGQPERGHEHG
ncbi:hypothetical protein ACL02T_08760 [Pseudonocardia sp. RS010]|uniref:hypothetical protein n=1 Tax=Pseudonocardia sp. RS010 TaxID=3385979 RepID=UPI0039A3D4EE